jgi:hypothetical protein
MPPRARARDKLLASFSRATYSGVAQTFNLALRRMQLLPELQLTSSFASSSLLQPYVVEPRSRANIAASRRAPCADVPLAQALAIALTRSAEAGRSGCASVKGSKGGIVAGGG